MAERWFKVGVALEKKPEVRRLRTLLECSREEALAYVVRWFGLAEQLTEDGRIRGYETDYIDEEIGREGFAEALEKVGWLEIDDGGVTIPRFERHMGGMARSKAQQGKRRDQSRARQRHERVEADEDEPDGGTEGIPSVVRLSASPRCAEAHQSGAPERETREKRQRRKTTPHPPRGAGGVVVDDSSSGGGEGRSWRDRFEELGVTHPEALMAAAQAPPDDRRVAWILEHSRTDRGVKDPVGWATSALRHGYDPPEEWTSKAEQRTKAESVENKRAEQRQAQHDEFAKEREDASNFDDRRHAAWTDFQSLDPPARRALLEQVPASAIGNRSIEDLANTPPPDPPRSLSAALANAMKDRATADRSD